MGFISIKKLIVCFDGKPEYSFKYKISFIIRLVNKVYKLRLSYYSQFINFIILDSRLAPIYI